MPPCPHVRFTELLKVFQTLCEIVNFLKFVPVLLLPLFVLIIKMEECVDRFERMSVFNIYIL